MTEISANKTMQGPILILVSAVLFSLSGLLMKYLPWGGFSLNGARNLLAFFVLFAFHKGSKHNLKITKKVLFGAVLLSATNTLFALANKMTTAGNAIILQFTMPVFVMLFSAIIYRKKPTKPDYLTAFFVLAGVLIFFLDSLSAGSITGDLLALLSGATYAGLFFMNASPEGDSLSSVLFGTILSAVIGLPFFFSENLAAAPARAWISLLVLGVLQQGLAFVCLSVGLRTARPITASLLSGMEPVLNPVLVAVFYGEMLSPLALIGALIVLSAIIAYNIYSIKKAE